MQLIQCKRELKKDISFSLKETRIKFGISKVGMLLRNLSSLQKVQNKQNLL